MSSTLELSSAAREEYQKLLVGVEFVCKISEVLVQELLDSMAQFGKELLRKSMIFIFDRPL